MKQFKTWADFAKNYDLVLFNECIKLNEGVILQEWSDYHHCEGERDEFDQLRTDDEQFAEQYEATDEAFTDWSNEQHQGGDETVNCECEVYQWYAIAISEDDAKYYNEKYNMDIFYSNTLGLYILPVYHYGTSWDYVNLA